MEMESMIERVAQAISMELYGGYPVGGTSDPAINAQWERTKKIAKAATEELVDKIEGLEADLASAVEVAYRHGATEWVRMNYPAKYAALKEIANA